MNIKRPNAVLVNIQNKTGKRWNVVYMRDDKGNYTHSDYIPYIKTDNSLDLDPFVNWLDIDKEFAHPCHAKSDLKGGWWFQAYDTYHEVMWNGKPIKLSKLNELGLVSKVFDKILDLYKNMTDEELLDELNVGRLDKFTMEDLNLDKK